MSIYPDVKNPDLVGTYPASVKSGGGYVWDDVLEYGVWCHPESGAPDIDEGNDYFYTFDNYEEALAAINALRVFEFPYFCQLELRLASKQ